MSGEIPIACNLDALSASERERRTSLTARIRGSAAEIRETETGFRLRLHPDPDLFRDVVDLIELERRCCPFLEMTVTFSPGAGPVYFDIGSGAGVKDFLVASGALGCAG